MEKKRTYLALDLGTRLGWAYGEGDALLYSGTADFSCKEGYKDIVYSRFEEWLFEFRNVDEIVYEKVMAHSTPSRGGKFPRMNVQAAHTYGYFEGHLMRFCRSRRPSIVLTPVHVQTLKKEFLGHGGHKVTKKDICARCHDLGWSGGMPGTDRDNDEADARALLYVLLARKGIDVVTIG